MSSYVISKIDAEGLLMANRVLRVLNLEDNAIKHSKIARVIKRIGEANIDWVRNLEDGMELIESFLQ